MSDDSVKTYRNPALARFLLAAAAGMAALCWRSFSWEVGAVLFAAFVFFELAVFRVRLVADKDNVRVVNYYRSHTLAWDDVVKVSEEEWKGSGLVCVIRLRTGEKVRAWGLYSGNGLGEDAVRASIEDLDSRRPRLR